LKSPYGYAGPISNNKEYFQQSELFFLKYIRSKNNIVSEFVRYHYLFSKSNKFEIEIKNEFNRNIISLKLNRKWEDIFVNEFSSTARNLIRKSDKEGYVFNIDHEFNNYNEFIELYRSNMNYVNATEFYYFTDHFFNQLKNKLKNKLILANVSKNGIIYCSSLFFIDSGIITYYLSGRNTEVKNTATNYTILAYMIKWGIENNYMIFNLGGGRTTHENDNLFAFKSHFSKSVESYFTGKRIHLNSVYNELKLDYIQKNGEEKFSAIKNILQFYK
jgi:lipid II:glycine glycyltransferase (peptidoglycan interpeptide bridge formation enzyme)